MCNSDKPKSFLRLLGLAWSPGRSHHILRRGRHTRLAEKDLNGDTNKTQEDAT